MFPSQRDGHSHDRGDRAIQRREDARALCLSLVVAWRGDRDKTRKNERQDDKDSTCSKNTLNEMALFTNIVSSLFQWLQLEWFVKRHDIEQMLGRQGMTEAMKRVPLHFPRLKGTLLTVSLPLFCRNKLDELDSKFELLHTNWCAVLPLARVHSEFCPCHLQVQMVDFFFSPRSEHRVPVQPPQIGLLSYGEQ